MDHKRGDTFRATLFLADDAGVGVSLTPYTITSEVRTTTGTLLSTCTVTKAASQITDPGEGDLLVADTTDWPVGVVMCDVKFVLSGETAHSDAFRINVTREVTA